MKRRLFSPVPAALSLSWAWLLVGSGAEYRGRVGLYSSPEFIRSGDYYQYSSPLRMTGSGWMAGNSLRYNGILDAGSAAWVADAATATTRRLGLITGAEFTSTDGTQTSTVEALTESGWIFGTSVFYAGSNFAGNALWLAQASTGVTRRIGLFSGEEFTAPGNGSPVNCTGYLWSLTESGWLIGFSQRSGAGQVVWVANARTGLTARLGLWGTAEYTRGSDGYQFSGVLWLTDSGWAMGDSQRYNGSTTAGSAVWLADVATGTSRRVGCYTEPEFTGADGSQDSYETGLRKSGYATGVSRRYQRDNDAGQAVWMADAATGNTRRLGFFTGASFTRSTDNYQTSEIAGFAENGRASGHSNLYNGAAYAGSAAWVADGADGSVRRVGFFTGPEFVRSSDSQQYSVASGGMTESGWLTGYSLRYNGTQDAGRAAWAADAATGGTRRVGLYNGAEFNGNNISYSTITPGLITESGYVAGTSSLYSSNTNVGDAAWVADAATGATRRVGLTRSSAFYSGFDNLLLHTVEQLTESGWISGSCDRFKNNGNAGQAAWIANAATGITSRVGLFSGAFTRADGYQETIGSSLPLTEGGQLAGTSVLYSGTDPNGQAAWLADGPTGVTTRIGQYDAIHTDSNHYQDTQITAFSKNGVAAGHSQRYGNQNQSLGKTAWAYDALSKTGASFDISKRKADSYSFSEIKGVTDNGVVYGTFQTFDSPDAGNRGFVWMAGLGTVVLDEAIPGGPAGQGWKAFTGVTSVTDSGLLTGTADFPNRGGQGAFVGSLMATPASATITGLARSGVGTWILTFQAAAGSRWILQSSADLASWKDGPVTAAAQGSTAIQIQTDATATAGFWRLAPAL